MIPMCWKCSNAIKIDVDDLSMIWGGKATGFGGCKEKPEIVNFEQARALCPLIHTGVPQGQ